MLLLDLPSLVLKLKPIDSDRLLFDKRRDQLIFPPILGLLLLEPELEIRSCLIIPVLSEVEKALFLLLPSEPESDALK
ncbi:hypothetical protein D3C73_1261600 [compost metagenome]